MPLHHLHTLDENTVLGIWQIQESAEALTALLQARRPTAELPSFKAETRQREWLAARLVAYLLLDKLGFATAQIARKETGQPYVPAANVHLSLTHSGSWAAALVSGTHQVGIDIELQGTKVQRAIQRFLNNTEMAAVSNDEEKMHVYWSAKETLYKVYAQKELDFKTQLLIQDFKKKEQGCFEGQIVTPTLTRSYTLQYQISPAFVLTYISTPPDTNSDHT